MPGKPPLSELLKRVAAGDKITHADENILRNLATRAVDMPDAIVDSSGIRAAWPATEDGIISGKLDGDLNSGSYATMSIWSGDPLADTGSNITVYDSSTLPKITSGKKIASGSGLDAHVKNGKVYLLVPYTCEEDQ